MGTVYHYYASSRAIIKGAWTIPLSCHLQTGEPCQVTVGANYVTRTHKNPIKWLNHLTWPSLSFLRDPECGLPSYTCLYAPSYDGNIFTRRFSLSKKKNVRHPAFKTVISTISISHINTLTSSLKSQYIHLPDPTWQSLVRSHCVDVFLFRII